MKQKKYYSQALYFMKAILVIIVIGVTFFIITQFSDKIAQEISIKLRKNMVIIEYVVNGIFGLIALASIALILLRGKPAVTLSHTTLRTNRFKKDFAQLKSYHPGKGGSEPYVISHEGKQYDLELSWFSKKDQKEIEAFIKERVATI
ncbi:hypothetical protein IMCC3317_34020 [Kordia antarctica]|uniref:Uncharacterized protein n=1 Tax=Kordia antarctica TaxID=1218801 RepID=A0A7L4ZNK1_9FLAO|nr:hypothetical protein [Kordia antarctica]QHI38019.1 hypothetical protein IMCC3317_34020 [Kordia antarctica]